MTHPRRRAAVLLALGLLTACSTGPVPWSSPPPVTVTGEGPPIEIEPWSYCWTSGRQGACADGAPPDSPPDVGRLAEVGIAFPRRGWEFEAGFQPAGGSCGPIFRVPLVMTGEEARLGPVGPADTYDVTVSGRGPEGDLVITFRWTTPVSGPTPPARNDC